MNSKDLKIKTVVCYGEVLWDILPTQTKPGGAPMNVAYHLRKFGIDSRMISRVGADELGNQLTQLLDGWSIPAHYCPADREHGTGKVNAQVLPNNEMSYTIMQPVAWDFIEWNEGQARLVRESDAFVFGSLVTRDETSRKTLYKLIEEAKFKVFDINLRPPFYSQEVLEYLLGKCDLLKLNENELALLSQWYPAGSDMEENCVRFLQKKFNIDEVIVTKGSEGATYYTLTESCSFPGYQVTVKDTVGSGDSFLAAFLAKKIQGATPAEGMKYAAALGAFVASHEGACPAYEIEQLNEFINHKELELAL